MKEKTLKTAFNNFLLIIAFLLPIFFVPYIVNPISNSKIFLTIFTAFISVLGVIFLGFKKKKWQILLSPISVATLIFAAFILVSSLASHQYPAEQLLGMGGVYLSLAAILLFAPTLIKGDISKKFLSILNISAVILAVISILQAFGLGLPQLINSISILNFPNNLAFSPTGSAFITIQFLSIILLANIFDRKAEKGWQRIVLLILLGIALGVNVWAIIPGNEAAFKALPLNASASIARESLSVTRTALFGFGPSSYDNAYNILKPIWINGQEYWQFVFDSAFNLPLTMIVSAGVLALLSWLFLLFISIKTVSNKNADAKVLKTIIYTAIIWQFLAPANIVTLALLALTLVVFIAANEHSYKTLEISFEKLVKSLKFGKQKQANQIIVAVVTLVLTLAVTALFYNFSRSVIAYRKMYQSNVAATKNNIPEAYEYQKQAKNLAPHIDSVRRTYALINLEIAIALSNKTELNPAEQDQVLQLVNQAIREAKAAAILDPQNYQNWLTIAEVYLQLIETTPQAQQEAFDALATAVNYNQNNPDLRMKLGQLFFSLQRYEEAANFFSQAAERKPDLARAYYALAKSFQANQQFQDAENALIKTLTLLTPETADYIKVENELNDISAQIESEREEAAANQPAEATNVQEQQTNTDSELDVLETEESNLSNLLDQDATEQIIQDEALTTEQETVAN